MQHLRTLLDLTPDDVRDILKTAADLKTRQQAGERLNPLAGRVLSMIFEKPSLRTRSSFEAAMVQLGGGGIFMTAKDAGLHGREAMKDVARVLGGYSDAIALRTYSQQFIEDFAEHTGCPVINALSDDYHPCQALTDLFTIQEALGGTSCRIAFVGDGNNVARSLAYVCGMLGTSLVVASPEGYQLSPKFLDDVATRFPGADIVQTDSPTEAVAQADIIYTDVWASMGQEAEQKKREAAFADFQVNAELMKQAPATARFMHDLPAHRGEEVTDEVIDGPQSLAFQQAENRMHLAKGLLVWLLS